MSTMNKQSVITLLRKTYNQLMEENASDEEVEWCFTRASPRDFHENNRKIE